MTGRFRSPAHSILALCAVCAFSVPAAAGGIRTITEIFPPFPIPEGVTEDGHLHAVIELEPASRERLKLEVEDVAVIEDVEDPAFCMGFYEIVIKDATGTELTIASERRFPGVVVTCDPGGMPQGPSRGDAGLDFRFDKGDTVFGFPGRTLQIWQVRVVRDPDTGAVVQGPNGEPFMIAERIVVALEGILASD